MHAQMCYVSMLAPKYITHIGIHVPILLYRCDPECIIESGASRCPCGIPCENLRPDGGLLSRGGWFINTA